MPTTSNFGWTTPADTDLVKDGAAAIRTLGNGIDTSFLDLKGGTTGQVLSKTSNTDLDFTWTNGGDITEVVAGTGMSGGGSSGSVTLTNTVATAFDAAGDLVYGTGADTFTKLALGTAGQVLKVNSGATAPEWGAAGGALSIAQIASGSLTSGTQLQLSSLTSYDTLILRVNGLQWATSSDNFVMTINNSSAEVYDFNYGYAFAESTYVSRDNGSSGTKIYLSGDLIKRDSGQNAVIAVLTNCKSSGFTTIRWTFGGRNSNNFNTFTTGDCIFKSSAAVSTLEFKLDGARTFSAGAYTLWGA